MRCLLYLTLALLVGIPAFSQSHIIKGKVTDTDGDPIPSATVTEKGTSNATTTNSNGDFSLRVKPGATLLISSVGYADKDLPLKGQTLVNIALTSTVKNLADVVVVAYGTQQRSQMTSAQSSVSNKDFEGQAVTRLDQALQGRASGVQVTNTSGAPGSDVRIRIRGANSIFGDNGPLYVIDGFVGGDFNVISPDDVADIQILKDVAATKILRKQRCQRSDNYYY